MTAPLPVDRKPTRRAAAPRERGTSLRSLVTLIFAFGALAFLAWMIVVHPDHQSLYGPGPHPLAMAVSPPAPYPAGG